MKIKTIKGVLTILIAVILMGEITLLFTACDNGSKLKIYPVTVTNGTGDGDYEEGATVTITANMAFTGQQFKNWTTASAGVIFANANAATTTFPMPPNAVIVTANFEAIPAGSCANGHDWGEWIVTLEPDCTEYCLANAEGGDSADDPIHIILNVSSVENYREIIRNSFKYISLYFSESVTSIGSGAFYGCTGLTSVTFERNAATTIFYTDTFPGNLVTVSGGIGALNRFGTWTREPGSQEWTKQP